MSGTSADGVDVALVSIEEEPFRVQLEAFDVFRYPTELRNRILQAYSPATALVEIGELNVLVGEIFAESALKLIKKSGRKAADIDFIGSHGQTLFHRPPSEKRGAPFTMQIGDGSVIAERTGILTVSDFRMADIAQGGEGAPLIPYVDWKLFTDKRKNRVFINLGGIANYTFLPKSTNLNDVRASDTGPANALLDSFVRVISGKDKDKNGELALKGRVNERLLNELMRHPFIKRKPPKSADREMFGEKFAESLIKKYKLSLNDFLATAAQFSAQSIALQLKKYPIDEIFISGGGEKNRALIILLKVAIGKLIRDGIPINPLDRLGIPGKAKEAVGFAILAYETLKGRPTNLPNVTGATQKAVLGKISPGRNNVWKLL